MPYAFVLAWIWTACCAVGLLALIIAAARRDEATPANLSAFFESAGTLVGIAWIIAAYWTQSESLRHQIDESVSQSATTSRTARSLYASAVMQMIAAAEKGDEAADQVKFFADARLSARVKRLGSGDTAVFLEASSNVPVRIAEMSVDFEDGVGGKELMSISGLRKLAPEAQWRFFPIELREQQLDLWIAKEAVLPARFLVHLLSDSGLGWRFSVHVSPENAANGDTVEGTDIDGVVRFFTAMMKPGGSSGRR